MNNKLSKFDKLMMAITFAEANAWEECGSECGAPALKNRQTRVDRPRQTPKQSSQLGGHALKAGY